MSMTEEMRDEWLKELAHDALIDRQEPDVPDEVCKTCAYRGDLILFYSNNRRRYCCVAKVALGDSNEIEEVSLDDTCDYWKWEEDE